MKISKTLIPALATLFCLCSSVQSDNIDTSDPAAVSEVRGPAADDFRAGPAKLFDFAPFSAGETPVRGFADPLGTGVDPALRIFAGKVHFMDVLGDFNVAKRKSAEEIELPKGALQGINLLDNFLAIYLSYDGRAYDTAQLNLHTAEVIKRNGLPVTTETSPLSLAGFGSVSENLKPLNLHWTRCPGREKRLATMRKYMDKNGWPCTVPSVCHCYVI